MKIFSRKDAKAQRRKNFLNNISWRLGVFATLREIYELGYEC